MANKFDVPPVQSTGILMQGLGQGLVEFGNVYGATKLATIEAEAQRNKEMRIMQMENIRNNMNDAFKYASYESDQARLANEQERIKIAQDTFRLAEEKQSFDIAQSEKTANLPDWKKLTRTETIPIYQTDDLTGDIVYDSDNKPIVKSYKTVNKEYYIDLKTKRLVGLDEVDGKLQLVDIDPDKAKDILEKEGADSTPNLQVVNPQTYETDEQLVADLIQKGLSEEKAKQMAEEGKKSGAFIVTGESDSSAKPETSNTPEPPAAVSPEVRSDSSQTADALANYMSGNYYSGDEAFKVDNNNGLISGENDSQGVMSRKDVLPIMEPPPQEMVSPDDAMQIPFENSGLLMQNNESATMPDLGTGAYGEMPLDQPTNVSGPSLPTGDTGYMPPDNADMQYPQARKQAIDLVESLKNANLPEDVIRSELLRLIQAIPQEQANSAYAQALVDVFNELFSGTN